MNEFGANSEKETGMLSLNDGDVGSVPDCLNLIVQGKPLLYRGSKDVRSLIESQGENSAYVNVRINETVLKQRDFENVPLEDGDSVDFLYYMGGGTCST